MEETIENDVTLSQKCFQGFLSEIETEQEAYLIEHPEIMSMLKILLTKRVKRQRPSAHEIKHVALHFTRPLDELEKEISNLNEPSGDITYRSIFRKSQTGRTTPEFEKFTKLMNYNISVDEKDLIPNESLALSTDTSSFVSIRSSVSTLVTPEVTPPHVQTTSEIFHEEILKIINEVVYSLETDESIQYDIAYVEIMNAVEVVMEIPVLEIRQDIADLLQISYLMFELQLDEKKQIAAQKALENSMNKKLRRKLRQRTGYKGYEKPQTSETNLSEHETLTSVESNDSRMQCVYNRYPKDRFGVYLPRDTGFSNESITLTIPVEEMLKQESGDLESSIQKTLMSIEAEIRSLSNTPKQIRYSQRALQRLDSLALYSAQGMLFQPSTTSLKKR